ncbi:MAG: hypothetical protein JWQ89_2598, partial [Devosia sp.]|nr:hypothetical protein [Devosia sp.]
IYSGNGFYFPTGGVELPLMWALMQVVVVLLGPGACALGVPRQLYFLEDPLALSMAGARRHA